MAYRFVVPFIALLMTSGCAVLAQTTVSQDTHHPEVAQQMQQRFQKMDQVVVDAEQAQGPQRMTHMQE